MDKDYLYGMLFTFNHLTGVWHCFKSEDKEKYFNTGKSEHSAKNIDHLLEVLMTKNYKSDKN